MDEDDVTSDRMPAFLYSGRHEDDEEPEDEPAGMPRKTIALIASGGLALLLMIGLVVAALVGDDPPPTNSAATKDPNNPVVPVVSASPTEAPPSPTEAPSPTPSISPSKPKATKSPTPTKTTAAPGTVTSASLSLSPGGYEGACNGGAQVTTTATLRITVSSPGTTVRWTVNGQSDRTVVQSTSYTTSWEIRMTRRTGTYNTVLKVSSPNAMSDTATFTVRCRG